MLKNVLFYCTYVFFIAFSENNYIAIKFFVFPIEIFVKICELNKFAQIWKRLILYQ